MELYILLRDEMDPEYVRLCILRCHLLANFLVDSFALVIVVLSWFGWVWLSIFVNLASTYWLWTT